MTVNMMIGQFFALVASTLYLWVFLYIIHNAVIRMTPLKSRISKALIATGFLMFSGTLFTWMGANGYGSSTHVLPSHVLVFAYTWGDYFFGTWQDRTNG